MEMKINTYLEMWKFLDEPHKQILCFTVKIPKVVLVSYKIQNRITVALRDHTTKSKHFL